MGILLGFGRGALVAITVMFAFGLLKRLVIAFGLLFAFVKFAIILAFLVLLASIACAIIRGWSENKHRVKET